MEDQNRQDYFALYDNMNAFREPLTRTIIDALQIATGSRGLDAGCSIGVITQWLSEKTGAGGEVTGLDFDREAIRYAQEKHSGDSIHYVEGDVNSLPFEDLSFDWIWSMDTVWPGPKEFGCPAEEPDGIANEYYRVLRPGGKVNILLWSSQKLLPGYPGLEARLNTTTGGLAPFREEMAPGVHLMNAGNWLQKAGFKEIFINTFPATVHAPLDEVSRKALEAIFNMLWGKAGEEVSAKDWELFRELRNPESLSYILNNPHYYGFYTYTLFQGKKP